MKKACFLDFEFNGIHDPSLNLVSVAATCYDATVLTYQRFFWLYGSNQNEARSFFSHLIREGYVFVSYVMEAEARGLLSLFKDDKGWLKSGKAVDLYLEYRCLLNHHHKYAYGEQYINGRVIKTSPPPNKWQKQEWTPPDQEAEEDDRHHKPSYSLAACCFKLLGVKIDTDEKTRVRDIIIRGDKDEITAARADIEAYNKSDIVYLPQLLRAFQAYYLSKGFTTETWLKAALKRGDYAIRTARMTALGYPINNDKVTRFTNNVELILKSAAEHCNETSPEVNAFRFDKKHQRYVATEKNIRDWIKEQKTPYWRKTAKGSLSLSKEAFSDWYDSQSGGFGGAYSRYLKTKQSLNGFLPGASKRGRFKDFIGSDGRVRPNFGIYGSQSSRSQPGATGFLPLKAHWMRNFLEAPGGRALCGVDYSSVEFLIAAVLSQDDLMMDAYRTGDVYLAFAKATGLAPLAATKETHKLVRDMCKALVLGISYDMSARGLAPRLTQIARREITEDAAQKYIDLFYQTYSQYWEWKQDVQKQYEGGYLELSDGWIMWGDNDNRRSIGNYPVQGMGAVIMREAVALAQDAGLDIIFTLHDALYMEFDAYDIEAITWLKFKMQSAFAKCLRHCGKTPVVRVEGEAWAPCYKDKLPEPVKDIKYLEEYVDQKGESDLQRYRPYFT